MTIQETVERLTQTYTRQMNMLELFPDLDIRYVSDSTISLGHATYAENMHTLHQIRQTLPATLESYYMNGPTLSLRYVSGPLDIIFYCTDVEHALLKVGGGKCSLQSQTTTETTQEVVCAL
jgi:hypothetical protein